VNSEPSWTVFVSDSRALYEKHKHVTWAAPRIGEDRSLDQNALSHVWYGQVDKEAPEVIGTTRRYCKLHFGVPILRAEEPSFQELYDRAIKPFDYETKLEIMEIMTVTSLMSRDQMYRYMSTMQVHYAEQGIVLKAKGEYAKLKREQNE